MSDLSSIYRDAIKDGLSNAYYGFLPPNEQKAVDGILAILASAAYEIERLERECERNKIERQAAQFRGDALAEELHQLKAQAAAMRGALEKCYAFLREQFTETNPETGEAFSYDARPTVVAIADALSIDAGRKVQDVVEAACAFHHEAIYNPDSDDLWLFKETLHDAVKKYKGEV